MQQQAGMTRRQHPHCQHDFVPLAMASCNATEGAVLAPLHSRAQDWSDAKLALQCCVSRQALHVNAANGRCEFEHECRDVSSRGSPQR